MAQAVASMERRGPDRDAAARLTAARKAKGYASAREFARSAKVNEVTYMHHESGYRSMTRHSAQLYAHVLGTTARELMYGADDSQLSNRREAPIVGVIRGGGLVQARPERHRQSVALLTNDENMVCLEVIDDDLYPAFRAGDLVLHKPLNPVTFDLKRCNGLECVVQLANGEVMLRQVLADANGKASLIAYHAPPRLGIKLVAAEPVCCVYRNTALPRAAE